MDEQPVPTEPATETPAAEPTTTVTNLDGSTPERGPDGTIPGTPVVGTPQAPVIATCTLQPNPRYGDEPLATIPGWTDVTILLETKPDDYGRLWQNVKHGDLVGYVQLQNLRIG